MNDNQNEPQKCPRCDRPYQRRPGDGYMLSCYHTPDCPLVEHRNQPTATEEAAR